MKQKKSKAERINKKLESIKSMKSVFDPNGSYTGVNVDNPNAKPIQDVDDL